MPTHIALLRGINVNVGGRNRVAMAGLCQVVLGLGYTDVATYIQSGNVVFASEEADTAMIAAALERAIAEHLGVRPKVVVLTRAELAVAGASAGAHAAGRARLRGAGGGDDPRRDRRGRSVPLQRCLRPLHRHRPIPVWSGDRRGKVRLNRGGNRTVNTALHMVAVTQIRGVGPGQAYVERLMARGKTRTEAVRLLRRRLSDVVFRALRADEQARSTAIQTSHSAVAAAASARAA
jgi:hypothetical protein